MLKIAWASEYCHPLPEGHRFPMAKYELIVQQLLYEGTISEENLFRPGLIDPETVTMTHTASYYSRLKSGTLTASEIRKTGFPHSPSLIYREEIIAQGTLQAALRALETGIGINSAGGTHHAFTNHGEAFCLLNDQAIAANYLLHKGQSKRILIVDLDVHQGNGTAEIFASVPEVFTFSMHGKNNYPFHKEKSDLDVELPDGITDSTYLGLVENNLKKLLDRHAPDFIFYQAGVDILSTDKLGKLAISRQGCMERDRLVLNICKAHNIPLVITMGGGYSEKLSDIVEAHCNTFRLAQEIFF